MIDKRQCGFFPTKMRDLVCIRFYLAFVIANDSVEEIHSVGTINNVETSYFTQLKNVT